MYYNKEMDSGLINKFTDEVNIETVIDYYNMLQKNLQTIQHKLPYFLTDNAHPKLFYIPFEVQITRT